MAPTPLAKVRVMKKPSRRVAERTAHPYTHSFVDQLLEGADWTHLHGLIHDGVQRRALGAAALQRFLAGAVDDAAMRLAVRAAIVSGRSWKRRVADRSPLSPLELERMTHVGEVVREARRVYGGDAAAAERFLVAKHRRLDRRAPILVAADEGGSQAVRELLARLEEGAPA